MKKLCLNGNDWIFKSFLGEDWIWRNSEKRNTQDIRWWNKGSVPSSVTYDLWKAGEIPNPYYEKNSLLIEWIPERTFIYKKTFTIPHDMKDDNLVIHFDGIDYECEIYLNDIKLGEHKSMFTPVEFVINDIVAYKEDNTLAVVIKKAPDCEPQISKTRYVKHHKSRMTYWWDFCPRMKHLGIWDDVYIIGYKDVKINMLTYDVILNKDLTSADIEIELELFSNVSDDNNVAFDIYFNNKIVYSCRQNLCLIKGNSIYKFTLTLDSPKLWWPNGYGEQNLYKLETNIDNTKHCTVLGFRDIQFLRNIGSEFKSKPYTLQINGQKIYMKGWNYVPHDVLYGAKKPKKNKATD